MINISSYLIFVLQMGQSMLYMGQSIQEWTK